MPSGRRVSIIKDKAGGKGENKETEKKGMEVDGI